MAASAPPPELQIDASRDDGTALLTLSGELDLQGVPGLSSAVDAALRPPSPLCIDLSGLTFIDSSGLAALVRADLLAKAADQPLRLLRPAPQVRRLLTLTGMVDVFDIDD